MGMFGFDDQSMMFDVTPVENQFILEYMLSAQGDYVKVYLYGLMHCYHPVGQLTLTQMAHDLLLQQDEVLTAYRYWERRGLVKRVSDNPPAFRYVNVKQHHMLGVNAHSDPAYEAFADSVYALFGSDRRIHGAQMMMCYEWVQELGLPVEVVILLLQHMADQRGKQFSIKSAGKLAAQLAEENARTIDDAEQVLSRDKLVWEGSKKVLRRMNKRRMPTEDEMNLYLKWYREWHFAPQAILEACAQMTRGDPSFAYLDGILKGIMGRSGAVSSAAEMEKTLRQEKDRTEPLKQILSILGVRDQTVNESTLRIYDNLRQMYEDQVIRLAARECAARGGRLDSVLALLEAWQSRGLKDEAQVQEHLERVRRQDAFLRRLYEPLGMRCGPGNADRTLLTRWQSELDMSEEMILHCAPWAAGVNKPMAYLDGILKDLAQRGIRTIEAADRDHEERKQRPAAAQAQGSRQVREQQYEQREYEASQGMPDWMKEMMQEEAPPDGQE